MHSEDVDFQLVPPGMHRRNAAERAIRTFKNHFIADLCSVVMDFPLHLWDRLLPQAILSLNLLGGSRLNLKLSAWAQLNSIFDFNRTPIAPPDICVIVHKKPGARTFWSSHGLNGWYTGPALDSYRFYNIWCAERICDTISWFPTKLAMPIASFTDLILAGIQDILHALRHPSPASPLALLGSNHVATLHLPSGLVTGLAAPTNKPVAAAPLRVAPKPGPDAPLRVATPVLLPTIIPPAAIPVLPTPAPPASPPVLPEPSLPPSTFENSTGPRGCRRRRQMRAKITPKPTTKAKTNAKPKSTTRPQHGCDTRSNRRRPARTIKAPLEQHALHCNSVYPRAIKSTLEQYALHGNAFNPDTGKIAEYRKLSRCSEGALWQASNAEEIGRLAQGLGPDHEITSSNTIFFISRSALPKGCKATYLRVVSAHRLEKSNPRRVCWTVGGDCVDYPGVVTT
jgi:hypothetical protein